MPYTCPMHAEVRREGPGACPKCGMDLEPLTAAAPSDDQVLRSMTRRFWAAAALAAPVLLLAMGPMAGVEPLTARLSGWLQLALSAPAVFWAGWPFFARGWQSLLNRRANMFTLLGLGIGVAFVASAVNVFFADRLPAAFLRHGQAPVYFETAVTITALALLGQVLELRARRRTGEAVGRLMSLTPPVARLLRDGRQVEVPLEDVRPGDRLLVRPGERAPVDGLVLEGRGAVDESMISGESMPVEKTPGDALVGGTISLDGALVMEARRVGRDTLLARIVALVGEAQRSRAAVQRVSDAVAARFVPAVVLAAVAAFVAWACLGPAPALTHATLAAVAVLVIACPCALGLATPMSIMVGIGRAAGEGLLIRSAEVLEALEKADTLVLDKTGTLTEGRPQLTECLATGALAREEVLRLAAAVENLSGHPLARAVVEGVRQPPAAEAPVARPVEDFRSIAGWGVQGQVGGRRVLVGTPELLKQRGVAAADAAREQAARLERQGQTVMFVAVDGAPAGLLAVADPIKPSAPEAVRTLRNMGLETIMLTGDNWRTARAVASQLAIARVEAEVKPADKQQWVKRLRSEGRVVVMAGDGVNDAPSLAAATVGIAMGGGAEAAIESADVTLVGGDLWGIVRAVRLSRAVMRNVRQNLFLALAYNAAVVPIAAGALYPAWGILPGPMIAAAAMSLSSLSVIGNALRLRGPGGRGARGRGPADIRQECGCCAGR